MAHGHGRRSPSADRTGSHLTSSPHLSGNDATEGGLELCRASTPPQADTSHDSMFAAPPEVSPSHD